MTGATPLRLFAVWARDGEGRLDERQSVREAHRARLRQPVPGLRVLLAGPLLGGPGGTMNGTLLVVEAADAATVEAFVADDPYVHAGVYKHIDIRPWQLGLGAEALAVLATPARAEDPAH